MASGPAGQPLAPEVALRPVALGHSCGPSYDSATTPPLATVAPPVPALAPRVNTSPATPAVVRVGLRVASWYSKGGHDLNMSVV